MKKFLFPVILLIFIGDGIIHAEINNKADLDTFNGIKWGRSKEHFSEKEFRQLDKNGITRFIKKNENWNLLGIKPKEVHYGVDPKSGFDRVWIKFFFEDSEIIMDKAKEYFGSNPKYSKFEDRAKVEWVGNKIRATLSLCKSDCFGKGKDPTIYIVIISEGSLRNLLKEFKKEDSKKK
jgi:hypothetical protein